MSTSTATPTTTTATEGGDAWLSTLHAEVLEAHILTRLDGPTLASASCASPALRDLSSDDHLWSHVCHSTWPSISLPPLRQLLSSFPGGPRRFFSRCFPIPDAAGRPCPKSPSPELISAVDIRYRNELVLSRVRRTETQSGWFRCSPFRIDMLEAKDAVQTGIEHPEGEDACRALAEDMTLSWILIDPVGLEAADVSSHRAVSVQRHWLSGEVQARFATVVGAAVAMVVVTCGEGEGGGMQVREVKMEVEDMDGINLNGKESMVILKRAMEGKRGKGKGKVEEGMRRYREFVEKKKERRDRKVKREGTLDVLCVAFGVSIFAASWFLLLF